MLVAFLATGLFLSAKSGFFQLLGIRRWVSGTIISALRRPGVRKSSDGGSISQTGALNSALAACLGTGNIVGVATALTAGGPGAVLWMWISAVLGMMTCCCENILGVKYRVRNEAGEWAGGPMMYIERGLGMKGLAKAFCIFLIGASLGMGNMTQANSAAAALSGFGISPVITGILLAVLTLGVISGGVRRIAAFADKLIPPLSALYILAAFAVIAANRQNLAASVHLIMSEAFTLRSAMGFGIAKAARYGIARGVFSNEAGLGSSPIIHSAADTDRPAIQGYWGILEVFLDTVFMCTVTSLALLCSGAWQSGKTGIEMSALAFSDVLGAAGTVFIRVCVCLFALATLIAWSYYGKKGAEYLFPSHGGKTYDYLYAVAAFAGCVVKLESVWSLSDTLNGLMSVPNLFAVVLLSGKAIAELKAVKGIPRGTQRIGVRSDVCECRGK